MALLVICAVNMSLACLRGSLMRDNVPVEWESTIEILSVSHAHLTVQLVHDRMAYMSARSAMRALDISQSHIFVQKKEQLVLTS